MVKKLRFPSLKDSGATRGKAAEWERREAGFLLSPGFASQRETDKQKDSAGPSHKVSEPEPKRTVSDSRA